MSFLNIYIYFKRLLIKITFNLEIELVLAAVSKVRIGAIINLQFYNFSVIIEIIACCSIKEGHLLLFNLSIVIFAFLILLLHAWQISIDSFYNL
jgi:hypothetical protein